MALNPPLVAHKDSFMMIGNTSSVEKSLLDAATGGFLGSFLSQCQVMIHHLKHMEFGAYELEQWVGTWLAFS